MTNKQPTKGVNQSGKPTHKKTICVDLDGAIHNIPHGWKDGSMYGEPVEGAWDALKILDEVGFEIIILTARREHRSVYNWLKKWEFTEYEVTNIKPPALAYIDDRGIRFTNWQDIIKYFT